MRRFFITEMNENQFEIGGTDARHMAKVLRLQSGNEIAVVLPHGEEFQAELIEVSPELVRGKILAALNSASEPPLHIVLVQGLPKGDKLELIIQKCTELGITEIWPVATERSVVRLEGSKAEVRRERWQRIAMEAAKQCKRQRIPQVRELQGWNEMLQSLPDSAQGILLWETEDTTTLRGVLAQISQECPIYIFVGPEGGLTATEVKQARQRGIQAVTLGPRILRTETAGLAALAIIMYQMGDLGG